MDIKYCIKKYRDTKKDEYFDFILNENVRLIKSIVKKYRHCRVEESDLFAAGLEGLYKAVEKYDLNRGVKFSTYAVFWIKRYIQNEVKKNWSVIHIPFFVVDLIKKVGVMKRDGKDEKEILKSVGYNKEQINYYLDISPTVSIHGDGEQVGLEDLCFDDKNNPVDIVCLVEAWEKIFDMVDKFDDRTKKIFVDRFGLGDDDEKTLEKLGQETGLCRERARQILKECLEKMNNELKLDKF